MIYIEYSECGASISDFDLVEEIEKIKAIIDDWHYYYFSYESDKYLQYSTSNIFNLLMLKIAQQEIDSDIIMFRYNDKAVPVNHYGQIENWPKGFLIDIAGIYEGILKAGFKHRRECHT